MGDYVPEFDDYDLDGLDLEPDAGWEVPEAQPALGVDYAPQLSGEQLAQAAASLVNSPQAQEFFAEQQAAYDYAEREAMAPVIHAAIDKIEAELGVTVDRRVVIEDAESIAPSFAAEYGQSVETAERALRSAVRKDAGRQTYDDVIARAAARLR
jgi:hypothetical protein